MSISGTTKYLALPSTLGLAAGTALLLYSGTAENRYHAFVTETTKSIPALGQFDALDNSSQDLADARKALTHYMVQPMTVIVVNNATIITPATYHHPDVDDSMNELDSARVHLTESNRFLNDRINQLDKYIERMEGVLEGIERGKSEAHYEPQRTQIRGLQELATAEMEQLREEIPSDVLEERASFRGKAKTANGVGWVLSILGGLGLFSYGIIRFTDGRL